MTQRDSDSAYPIVVIKVGGSLLDWPALPERLDQFLRALPDANRPVLIVGGGGAVDWVRAMDRAHQLDPSASHYLAIAAMALTARLLVTLMPESELAISVDDLQRCWRVDRTPILDPGTLYGSDQASTTEPLPESWSLTSDSIAARIAHHLNARELILLKSIDPPHSDRSPESLVAHGLVDPCFPQASLGLQAVTVHNLRNPNPC